MNPRQRLRLPERNPRQLRTESPSPVPKPKPKPKTPPAPPAPEEKSSPEQEEDLPPWVQLEPAEESIPPEERSADSEELDWQSLIRSAELSGLEWQSASRSECVELKSTGVVLKNSSSTLTSDNVRKSLERALSKRLGHPFSVTFQTGEVKGDTVWAQVNREEAAARQKLIQDFRSSGVVSNIINQFEGEVREDSVDWNTKPKPLH